MAITEEHLEKTRLRGLLKIYLGTLRKTKTISQPERTEVIQSRCPMQLLYHKQAS
jgi:hypothetical protein